VPRNCSRHRTGSTRMGPDGGITLRAVAGGSTGPTPRDRELLDAARAGAEDAFRRLVEPHWADLHAHCYRMLGSLHDSDDAHQETLLRAWRALPRFGGPGLLRPWLYRIATNVCLDALARAHGGCFRSITARPPARTTIPVPRSRNRFGWSPTPTGSSGLRTATRPRPPATNDARRWNARSSSPCSTFRRDSALC
jgi:Sigma-70 region 2